MPNNKSNSRSQVNLAHKAGTQSPAPKKTKKKNPSTGKTVIVVLLVVVILALIAFLVAGVWYVLKDADEVNDPATVSLTSHDKTPAEYSDKVAYYVLGLLGKDSETANEVLSILCYDKVKQTINILEIPQDTYLGNEGQWTVLRAGNVWNNPKPLDWCETCRKKLEASEITDGKHSCNTPVTQKPGSSSEDLCDVFNDQYGLPVDGYFMLSQDTLVKLVNLLGGVDVSLESEMKVGEITYPSGTQTLDGNAALQYVINRKNGISGDIDRLVRQRKVLLAIFQRLQREGESKLLSDSIGPLMNGSSPILSNFDRYEMSELIAGMHKVKPEQITAYVIPGEAAATGGATYFSVHKADLLTLLNEAFHPYGDALTEDDLGLTEIATKSSSDTRKQVLSEIAVTQSGAVTTTAPSTTTTKAAA